MVDFIESKYPELKETEDEKIRNEIILYIGSKDINLSTHNRWISWLEKQRTKNSTWSEDDESNIEEAIYYIRREPYRECDVEPIVDWLRTIKERIKGE